ALRDANYACHSEGAVGDRRISNYKLTEILRLRLRMTGIVRIFNGDWYIQNMLRMII
ncbi:unnamed protein product, partial [marine sediment metagenome]